MTNHSTDVSTRPAPGSSPRWSREQIRAARLVRLVPLLEKRNLCLVETGAGNFHLSAYPGLIVKDCYWRCPDRHLAGNSIEFFVQILRLSFHDAMKEINSS